MQQSINMRDSKNSLSVFISNHYEENTKIRIENVIYY